MLSEQVTFELLLIVRESCHTFMLLTKRPINGEICVGTNKVTEETLEMLYIVIVNRIKATE